MIGRDDGETSMIKLLDVVAERPSHGAAIERLNDRAFGPNRLTKTAYRFRDGIPPIAPLGFVIEPPDAPGSGEVAASIRFWPAVLPDGSVSALLGPIAVQSDLRGTGYGSRLIHHGLMRARALGYPAVVLVGDRPYYVQFGFSAELMDGLRLPGPVDRSRLLGLEFTAGVLDHQAGLIRPMAADNSQASRV
ncbi:MAG: N-acetyltransferase [Alphaproteobacteria bacterium]|nr:N-acetyltransferase [Alphaproteobacteria bacterium SS10]